MDTITKFISSAKTMVLTWIHRIKEYGAQLLEKFRRE